MQQWTYAGDMSGEGKRIQKRKWRKTYHSHVLDTLEALESLPGQDYQSILMRGYVVYQHCIGCNRRLGREVECLIPLDALHIQSSENPTYCKTTYSYSDLVSWMQIYKTWLGSNEGNRMAA